MLFNSFDFVWFLVAVFTLYWSIFNRTLLLRNLFLVTVSYVFYGWWDWRFLSLIIFSSAVDYLAGIQIEKSPTKKRKKLFLSLSLLTNLGLLGFFKYYNFFASSLAEGLAEIGVIVDPFTLDIVLPVGISFYTFQTISYSIDVYRGKLKATRNPVAFFAYVSFFPQLVAGPIERAVKLLPQFNVVQKFTYAMGSSGMRLILWGLFKKVVLADNCAVYANQIFDGYGSLSTVELAYGSVLFALQIYGDFSGYSDIAIGTARLFGFNLMTNFRTPYFSRDIAEFWRRWHISLSTWFRDYLYIPLGGSRGGRWMQIRNTFIIFIVSGFWHGANWTFIAWGALNAIFFLPLLLAKRNRNNLDEVASGGIGTFFKQLGPILLTFTVTCFAWIFFRAESLSHAFEYINQLFSGPFMPANDDLFRKFMVPVVVVWLLVDWLSRKSNFDEWIGGHRGWARHSVYYLLILMIAMFGSFGESEFIYFQF